MAKSSKFGSKGENAKFASNHGAFKKGGHSGLISEKAGGGKGKGNFLVTPSNVGKLGHK